MSLGTQFRQLGQKAAIFRQETFGRYADDVEVRIEYNRGELVDLVGYYSTFADARKVQEAGFLDVHDGIVRISKGRYPRFVPARDAELLIRETAGTETREVPLIINEIRGTHPASAEWVLGCDAKNSE